MLHSWFFVLLLLLLPCCGDTAWGHRNSGQNLLCWGFCTSCMGHPREPRDLCYFLNCKNLVENTFGQDGMLFVFIPECCTLRFLSCCCCCCGYSLNCKNLVENTFGQDGMPSFFIPECCILGFLSCCCCYSLAAGTPLGDTEIQVRISFGEGPGGSRGALKGVPGGGLGGCG